MATSSASSSFSALKTAWDKVPIPPQHRKTVVIVAASAIVAGILAATILDRPHYVPVVSGVSPASAGQVTQELTTLKIPYQLTQNGATVEVPKSQADTARVDLAVDNLPSTGQVSYQNITALSSAGLTSQQFSVEQLGVLQQDLAATIGTMTGVKSAEVQISVPPQSIWAAPTAAASKAAVYLSLQPGYNAPQSQVRGIIALVAQAVPGLSDSDVSVVNQSGQLLNPPAALSANSPGGIVALQDQMDQTASGQVNALLTPMVGPGNVQSVVHYQLNAASSTNSQTVVRSSTPSAVSTQKSTTTGGSSQTAAGTAGNTAPTYVGGTGPSSSSSSASSTQYVVGHASTSTSSPAGAVSAVTATVILNQKSLKGNRTRINTIRQAVGSALGIPAAKQAADITVLASPFAQVPVSQAAAVPIWANKLLWAAVGGGVIVGAGAGWLLLGRKRRRKNAGMISTVTTEVPYYPGEETSAQARAQQVIAQLNKTSKESPDAIAEALTRLIGPETLDNGADVKQREPVV